MPLKLITGPANSGRAGEIMRAYRVRLAEQPILVVPALRDVEHSLRELALQGAVFGANVVRFAWLYDAIAERCGAPPAKRSSEIQRELLAEEAIGGLRLRELAASARQPGFARAAVRFVAELERAMIEPQAFERALAQWPADGPRRRYARELASLYSAYRDRLEAAGLVDDELFQWRAVDALRERPERFGRTPVFVYGFDDFTPLELDALETLATAAAAPVTVSLPYERGRAAFRAIAPLHERLSGLADELVELPAASDHYRERSRAALFHLERSLYEEPAARADPDGAVRLLSAGGERAEVELVAAEVLRLLRAGTSAGEVAVIFRDPGRYASVIEQVFGAYGVPFSIERRVPLAHTALGRGILALLRCATPQGTADDLIAYLRTPGVLDYPRLADRLEADVRTAGSRTAAEARRIWEQRRSWRLEEIDRLRAARSGNALLVELDNQLDRLFSRAYLRRAPIFSESERDDPRVATSAHEALADLDELVAADPRIKLDLRRVHDKLARVEVMLGERTRPDSVQVAAPEAVRARRFEAVFVCGLQTGEFPRPGRSEPFLPDEDRREITAASGLPLGARDDDLDRERHLFYVCASRAESTLWLSSRFTDEDGNPQVPSFLLDDVADVFAPALTDGIARRSLSDVTWRPELAPTEAEWRRAVALAAPRAAGPALDGLHVPEVLEAFCAGRAFSAAALEAFADCPVKWLVDRVLKPAELEPDPEPLVRGSFAHAVLEGTYRRLRERSGSARVTAASLELAERILLEVLEELQPRFRISPNESRFRTAVRRLEFDLLRHLRREAELAADFEPAEFELSFGDEDGGRPALELHPEGVSIRGRIDRVDVSNGHAVVRDYKTGKRAYPVARWEEDHRLQVALYMIAVRELLGLDPVGGFYVPLSGSEANPRGLLKAGHESALGSRYPRNDVRDSGAFEDQLTAARARVGELAERMRAGDVRPCPETCAWNGGCAHPSICRLEER